MKKLLGLLLLSVIWGLYLNSQNIITPYSRLIINNYSTKHYNHYPLIKSINSDFQNYIPAFITLEDKSNTNLSDLESLGIKIEGRYHNVIASLIPINHFEDASNIKGIKSINIASKARQSNDKARVLSFVDMVLNGTNLPKPYTGKGVVVGM